jgi:Cu(I)/Ag(I) efflux system membrane fusion protein
MNTNFNSPPDIPSQAGEVTADEGGLRAPPGLTGWKKAWWWFDFIILVKLARLRFIAVLVVIGVIITQWDTLAAYYDKWTRPTGEAHAGGGIYEWFCPMHPSIVRDNPKDKCPICFMPLSKRKKGDGKAEALPAGVVNRVQLSPYRIVLAGIQTWTVDYEPLIKEISAVGYVEFNERDQRTVAARVNGRIDQLFVNETGRMVEKDDVLASLYSPDLVVSVQNLLNAKRAGDTANQASSRRRLQLLGISDDQLDEIERSNTANTHLNIRSPIRGHIIKKYVREGQYVEEGMPLYEVADLSTVWIQAQIYEDDIAFLPVDQTEHPHEENDASEKMSVVATTRAFPNEAFVGELAFVYPHVDQNTRTVAVRFDVQNPQHKLRPGTTANVLLKVQPKDVGLFTDVAGVTEQHRKMMDGLVLAVPDSSVIDTGTQKIVYRESSPGVYEGVEVTLGHKMQNSEGVIFYPVLRGLKQGERIVTAGSFLVDAETRLNPAAGSIYFGGSGGSKSGGSVTVARPSTPEDPHATTEAALAKLSPEDRKLAELQRQCPILGTPLGAMGTPVKIEVEGEPVFLCCAACKEEALANPRKTLAKVAALKKGALPKSTEPNSATDEETAPPPADDAATATPSDPESEIQAALAELDPADQKLAEEQKFCAVLRGSRLGSMGKPVKVILDGEVIFVCCEGCETGAKRNPKQTVFNVKKLRELHSAKPKNEQ